MIDTSYNEVALVGAIYNLTEDHGTAAAIKYVLPFSKTDFTDPFIADMFQVMRDFIVDETSFDIITICEKLQSDFGADTSVLSSVGEVIRKNSSYSAIDSHKATVLRATLRRKIIMALGSAQEEINKEEDIYKSLGKLETTFDKLMGMTSTSESKFSHLGDLMNDWIVTTEDIIAGKEVEPGITTGLSSLDDLLGDKLMLPGSLFVIGANPGSGKTGLMVRMAEGMAYKKPDDQVLIYSLEMPNNQIADRFIGLATDNSNPKYYQDDHWAKISQALELYKRSNIYCCDSSAVSVATIKSDSRERAQHGKIACIMIDYLTLMEMPKKDRNDLSVGEVTKQLKRLAKELGCVVVLLCQLSRSNMQRANKRPIKSDLRDSGQIEQDADYILFPYRDKQFNEDSPAGDFAELILDKNRHGPTGTPYAKFKNGVWYECDQAEANHRCRLESN